MCVKIVVLQLPQDYISSIQSVFIDFEWQDRHWLKSDIVSRLHAFRLRFIQDFIYYDSHICFRSANVFLEE